MAVFYSEKMQKVRIIALSKHKYTLSKGLQEAGIIDIRKPKLELQDDREMESFPQVSERLVKVEGALQLLDKPGKKEPLPKRAKGKSLDELVKLTDSLTYINEIFDLSKEKERLGGQLSELRSALVNATMLTGIETDFSALKASAVLSYKLISMQNEALRNLEQQLKHAKVQYELLSRQENKSLRIALIVYSREKEAAVNSAMAKVEYSNVEISRYLSSTPSRAISGIDSEIKRSVERLSEISKALARISGEKYYELSAIKEMLEIEYDRTDISVNFKKTDRTFVLDGWISKGRMGELQRKLDSMTGGAYSLEMINDSDLAPTYSKKKGIFRPFDYLVDFYSPPRSDEIDPTYIFFISLALFYGLTVSDFGYGLVSLIIATLIIRKVSPDGLMGNVARIWQMFSVSIMFFGLLSNQFFGISLPFFTGIQRINWTSNIQELIVLTILMGLVMVGLGLALSFVNNYRQGHRKHAIAKIGAIFMLAFGTIAVAGMLFHAFPPQITTPAAIVAVVGIIVFVALSGMEAMEITNIIAHPISFLRMLGFGLASVVLASLIDKAFTPNPSSGAIVFILYLVIFIVLHVLNSIVSMFEGIVQGSRLNFIEFFSKFYKGGGTKFKPYYFKKNYTE